MIARQLNVGLSESRAAVVNAEMRVGSLAETITVSSEAPFDPNVTTIRRFDADDRRAEASAPEPKFVAPSDNVVNLQKRTAGVLPIRLDVPRAGTSLQFVKPLVVDQEVNVTLRYKRRG